MSKTLKDSRIFRLFALPSFFGGMGRAIDLGATMQEFNTEATDDEADYYSLLSDWQAVGDDLRVSTRKYGRRQTAS